MPASQDFMVFSAMPLGGRHEPDTAMPMFVVVPAQEVSYPDPRRLQIRKAVPWPLRAVFQRPEQRFRVRVVIAHSRPTTRWGDAKVMHLAQQGRRLHRRAIVGMQYQRLMRASFAGDAPL